ncbi:MAG: hypothetical protein QM775_34280 [Pirellulales bacterium]
MTEHVFQLDQRHIERRRPLWLALSQLWLDTELTDADLARIARTMTDSGLSLAALREVYVAEVAPAVYWNSLAVAGAWSGFDEDRLCERIVDILRNRPRRTRFMAWFPPTRRLMTYATERHWRRFVELIRPSDDDRG